MHYPRLGNMDVVAGDFHAIPFPDGAFDFAYSNVLDHIFDTLRFGREVGRVVKPGGVFFASLYPGGSAGGNDAWTAQGAASLDNKPQFLKTMALCGFDLVHETTTQEDMDLTESMPNARNPVWHQTINTVYLKRRPD